jgi:hypothetical protein
MTNEVRGVQSPFLPRETISLEAQGAAMTPVQFAQNLGQQVVQRKASQIFDVLLQQSELLLDQLPQIRAVRTYQQISHQFEELLAILENITTQSSDQAKHIQRTLIQTQQLEVELCGKQRAVLSFYQSDKLREQTLRYQKIVLSQNVMAFDNEVYTLEQRIKLKKQTTSLVSVSGLVFTASTTLAGLCLIGPAGAIGGFLAGATARKGAVTFLTSSKNALVQKLSLGRQQLQEVNVSLEALVEEQKTVEDSLRQSTREIEKISLQVRTQETQIQELGRELTSLRGIQDELRRLQNRYKLLTTEVEILHECSDWGILRRRDIHSFMNQIRDLRVKLAQVLHVPLDQLRTEELERQITTQHIRLLKCIICAGLIGLLAVLIG